MKKTAAVFLDRDGVINECMTSRVRHVNSPNQLHLIPGVSQAIRELRTAGFMIFVVTNQGGVGAGFLKESTLRLIHDRLKDELAKDDAFVDDIAFCAHKPTAGCICRKPEPGMIKDLAKRYGIDLSKSFMVGDMDTDIAAGAAAGVRTIKIGEAPVNIFADFVTSDLAHAAEFIIASIENK
ncbi:D-glycero-alpha-D-manno-heptose-1,7-bisphosphate 7-phosphatase [Paenibacillus aestuarii]|uniref:D,D-heptose 1,7-bisphosphate phosphatase n=1 Tax=Paenibacillus aestuarii TaxID=516965 RepID=A0ABW0K801_9BACL